MQETYESLGQILEIYINEKDIHLKGIASGVTELLAKLLMEETDCPAHRISLLESTGWVLH